MERKSFYVINNLKSIVQFRCIQQVHLVRGLKGTLGFGLPTPPYEIRSIYKYNECAQNLILSFVRRLGTSTASMVAIW